MKLNFFFTLVALISLIVLPTNVHAAYDYYASSSFNFNQHNYPSLAPTPSKKSAQSSSTPKPKSTAPQTSGDPARRISASNNPLPYNRDKALSAQIRDAFLKDFAKQMPDAADYMRDATDKNDIVQIMAAVAQRAGLDSGTMEGMMALWYGHAWAIANQQPWPSNQQYQAIAVQLKASLQNSSKWSQMGNSQRQEFVEHLAYPMFVQKANYQNYLKEGKRDAMARMAAATQIGLKKIGLNLQGLRLGDDGFSAS